MTGKTGVCATAAVAMRILAFAALVASAASSQGIDRYMLLSNYYQGFRLNTCVSLGHTSCPWLAPLGYNPFMATSV